MSEQDETELGVTPFSPHDELAAVIPRQVETPDVKASKEEIHGDW